MDETSEIRKILDETLKNLSRISFKSFKRNLFNCELPEGHNQIPWNELETVDAENIVDLMFRYYTTEHAPGIVLTVLDNINERQASLELRRKLKKYDATTKHHKQYKRSKDNDETIPKNKISSDESIEFTSCIKIYPQMDQSPKVKPVHTSKLPLTRNIDSRSKNSKQLSKSNNQEQKNIKLRPPSIPTPTPRLSSSTLESSVECTKDLRSKSTKKGSMSSSSNACAGKLSNQAKNISQVQETAGNKKQSGNPGLSLSPNVQCSAPEPKPETVKISDCAARNVPALRNKINHHKSDCTQQCHVPKRIDPRGKPLPDLILPVLDENNLERMEEHHKGKPHIFAKLLFRFFVPYKIYTDWTKETNFDGYGGKNAIPNNLREAIFKHVKNKFDLQENDKKKIRETINDLLRKPRTTGWPVLT